MDGRETGIPGRLTASLLLFAALWGCGGIPPCPKRVVVLGIDGMDPGFLERHLPDLPNLNRLRQEYGLRRLDTSTPPQSPVAWSTFITGLDPSGHGIFDFVHRDPSTMAPFSSMGEVVESGRKLNIGPWSLPLTGGKVVAHRQGKAFWQVLSEHGIPATVLRMPTNFPPLECRYCRELSGMGTPDMQGTYGTFTYFTDDSAESTRDVSGGRIVRVTVIADRVLLPLQGPVNSLRRDRRRTSLTLTVNLDPSRGAARFDLGEARFILRPGEWSEWIPVRFSLIPGLKSVSGMVRVFARQLSPGLRIYVSPVNIDPSEPELPISFPAGYSRELARAIGPFYTQGIAEDTSALRQGAFHLADYVRQSRIVAAEQLALLDEGLKQFRGGFFFFHFPSLDQDSHILWARHEDKLLETYRLVDAAVGRAREQAGDATFVVMSDHGFAAFTRAVHLNTWLMREGFLTLDSPADTGPDELFAHVDWSRTQAYALGLNSLYLNLEGRERNGIVKPGLSAQLLLRIISRRLREFRDPTSGEPVIAGVYPGGTLPAAPDLIVGYRPPYRCSWQSALGVVPAETVEDNQEAWIGDHCSDAGHVPGTLLANRPFRLADPRLADLTVTILNEFGISRPAGFSGRPVF